MSDSDDNTLKVWDTDTGACLLTIHQLPDSQFAAIDYANNRVLHASSEAWRFLGWRWFDPELKRLRLLPAEAFGKLPE